MNIKNNLFWYFNTICFFSTILILFWVLKFSAYGIDFTDEGLYLNNISNPFLYKNFVTQFGFIYHLFYNLLDGNIVWLRRLNVIIIFGLSTILTYFLINKITIKEKINKKFLFIISTGIACYSLNIINIQTPGYNHLNFTGLLLTCVGIVLIDKINFNKNLLAHFIIGLGGWLTFMAKPTSALGLAIIVTIYLLLTKNFNWRFILISILTTIVLLILSAYIIDGSISLFINRYTLALKLVSKMDLDPIFRIDDFNLPRKIKYLIFLIFLILLFFIFLEYKYYLLEKNFFIANIILCFFVIILLTFFKINLNPNLGQYKFFIVFGIIFACIFVNIFFIIEKKIKINKVQWLIFILFLFLPYIYALGTGNNYWIKSSQASFFYLIGSFAFIIPTFLKFHKFSLIIFLVLISQLITAAHIKERIEKPYRYNEPLRLSQSKIYINNKYHLKLSNEFSNYINSFKDVVIQSSFKKNDPVIDLSGQSPTLVYLIYGKSIGAPWIIGGYKYDLDRAKANFDLVNCKEISNAWIILEIKGRRSISTKLLEYLGADFPDQYQLMGSWKMEKVKGGYYKKPRKLELYKPINSELIFDSCDKKRKKN